MEDPKAAGNKRERPTRAHAAEIHPVFPNAVYSHATEKEAVSVSLVV